MQHMVLTLPAPHDDRLGYAPPPLSHVQVRYLEGCLVVGTWGTGWTVGFTDASAGWHVVNASGDILVAGAAPA